MKLQNKKIEYGDWQTPIELAQKVCGLLVKEGIKPKSLIEPTFGTGAFLIAALETFPTIKFAVGSEINLSYYETAQNLLKKNGRKYIANLIHGDFFKINWSEVVKSLPEPILIIGNPPWVTNTKLSTLAGTNLPRKSNVQNHRGIEAITGKSNFDISESIILKILNAVEEKKAVLAVLCKTDVARKVLENLWRRKFPLESSKIYFIDSMRYFRAAVDACLLFISTSKEHHNSICKIYNSLVDSKESKIIGLRENRLIADIQLFEKYKNLISKENNIIQWRSGIKHDCSKVMELTKENDVYRNDLGELVELEDDFLYLLLKSSDIAKGPPFDFSKRMLVTQKSIGEDTKYIKHTTPKTWKYLNRHSELLDNRSSQIYKKQPRFSIFGVGVYSFTPWKVAISGFYKLLKFSVIGPVNQKPVVLDDTCYFLGFNSEQEAACVSQILNSKEAAEFYSAFIFWDKKRPINKDILDLLDIQKLAEELNLPCRLNSFKTIPEKSLQLAFMK